MTKIRLGVVANVRHDDLSALLTRLSGVARAHGITLYSESALRGSWPAQVQPRTLSGTDRLDGMLALGGDGTLLRGARLIPPGTPILGINMGRVGFLTTSTIEHFDHAMDAFVRGAYEIDERTTLTAYLATDQGKQHGFALNDVIVHHAGVARVLQFRLWVNEKEVGQYSADGIIVATPTGSTAYSLSAGGPVVTPDVDVLIVTAISPHTLAVRPLVVAPTSTIRIKPQLKRSSQVQVSYDGHAGARLTPGDSIVVRRGADTIRLVRLGDEGFFDRVRQKLHWGDLSDREN